MDLNQSQAEIIQLLARKGLLFQSQMVTELLLPMSEVRATLQDLRENGLVEPKHLTHDHYNDDECRPWGLKSSPI